MYDKNCLYLKSGTCSIHEKGVTRNESKKSKSAIVFKSQLHVFDDQQMNILINCSKLDFKITNGKSKRKIFCFQKKLEGIFFI